MKNGVRPASGARWSAERSAGQRAEAANGCSHKCGRRHAASIYRFSSCRRNRVLESLRFADCSAVRAVSKAESTEQRPAEAALIHRKQQRPQRSELTILVELQLMRLASAPCTTAMLQMTDRKSQVWRLCYRDSALASIRHRNDVSNTAARTAARS